MFSHLGLVMLLTKDMSRCKAFYTELLGFEFIPEFSSPAEDFLFLHAKASSTNIALQDATKQSYGVPLEHGGIILGFAVQDADAVYQDWQSRSVELLSEVVDIGAGRIFTAKDPDGNYIQVYHLYPQAQELQKQRGLV